MWGSYRPLHKHLQWKQFTVCSFIGLQNIQHLAIGECSSGRHISVLMLYLLGLHDKWQQIFLRHPSPLSIDPITKLAYIYFISPLTSFSYSGISLHVYITMKTVPKVRNLMQIIMEFSQSSSPRQRKGLTHCGKPNVHQHMVRRAFKIRKWIL